MSVQISFALGELTGEETVALQTILGMWMPQKMEEAEIIPIPEEPVLTLPSGEPLYPEKPLVKKPNAREKKVKVTVPEDPTTSLTSPETQKESSTSNHASSEIKATGEIQSYSLDDLRNALMDYCSGKEAGAGIELLKDFDCARVSDIQKLDTVTQTEFVKLCKS